MQHGRMRRTAGVQDGGRTAGKTMLLGSRSLSSKNSLRLRNEWQRRRFDGDVEVTDDVLHAPANGCLPVHHTSRSSNTSDGSNKWVASHRFQRLWPLLAVDKICRFDVCTCVIQRKSKGSHESGHRHRRNAERLQIDAAQGRGGGFATPCSQPPWRCGLRTSIRVAMLGR